MWDLGGNKCAKILAGHNKKHEVLRACWAPPGTGNESIAMATGSADGNVRLWGFSSCDGADKTGIGRYQSLKVVGQLRHRNTAKGLDGQVYSCQFIGETSSAASSTGAGNIRLLTASDCSVHLWDVETRKRLVCRTLSKMGDHSIGGERNPGDLSFVFDAKPRPGSGTAILAVALSDGTIRVGNIFGKDKKTATLQGITNTHLTSLAWSDDGTTLVSCGGDGTVTVWDSRTWEIRSVLSGHSRPVYGAAFYPGIGMASGDASPKLLLSWSSDETIRAWDAGRASGDETTPLVTLPVEKGFPIYNCSVSGDGRRLAIAGGGGGSKPGFMGVPIKLVDLKGDPAKDDESFRNDRDSADRQSSNSKSDVPV